MDWTTTWSDLVDKLASWLDTLVLHLPNIVAAIVVAVLSFYVAKFARKVVMRAMSHVSPYREVNRLIGTLGYTIVAAVGLFMALGIVGLDKTVTTLLAGAGILGLALGFAFQDVTANFISGVLLSVRRPFKETDIIETNGFTGTVQEINLRSTHLRTFQGQIVVIPNKSVLENPLTNFTARKSRRIDLACGVAYGDDLEKARDVAIRAVESLPMRDGDRDVELFYDNFGGSSIDFKVRFWIDFSRQTDFLHAQSEAIMRLKTAFDEAGITIPFPIRTLDFGVVGGKELSEVWPRQ